MGRKRIIGELAIGEQEEIVLGVDGIIIDGEEITSDKIKNWDDLSTDIGDIQTALDYIIAQTNAIIGGN